MAKVDDPGSPQDFAHAFGDALSHFINASGKGKSEVARELGLETTEKGKRKGGSRISSYCRDSKGGKRPKPSAEILYLACTQLPGFSFEYNGYRINAEALKKNGAKPPEKPAEQLTFERQFKLTHRHGTVDVKVKRRPVGRIEVSVSLDAKAS